jgi:hypothetical protein
MKPKHNGKTAEDCLKELTDHCEKVYPGNQAFVTMMTELHDHGHVKRQEPERIELDDLADLYASLGKATRRKLLPVFHRLFEAEQIITSPEMWMKEAMKQGLIGGKTVAKIAALAPDGSLQHVADLEVGPDGKLTPLAAGEDSKPKTKKLTKEEVDDLFKSMKAIPGKGGNA